MPDKDKIENTSVDAEMVSDNESSENELGEEMEEDVIENEDSEEQIVEKKVYLPGEKLNEGEELIVDESAYRILHQAQTGAPCLSFDIIRDDLGNSRETYPLTMYLLAGTQAPRAHVNQLLVIKMSNLHGTKVSQDSDDDEDNEQSSDSEDEQLHNPEMQVASIKHQGCVNRVRCTQFGNTTLAASWSELGRINVWDVNDELRALNNPSILKMYKNKDEDTKPIFTFKGHLSEGFGLDWCHTEPGTLASGDCKGNIHIWRYNDAANKTWYIDQRPYNSHAPHSVEDLQWSPNERNVLASCSVDKSIKIWDTRVSPQSACMLTAFNAHSSDINVISWNKKETRFLVSGGDDGVIHVWDLRQFSKNGASPIATFKQHTAPVTTVEWHPEEATVFASGGADDQITQWDLSVESDESEDIDQELKKLPPQLLFIHQGQTDIKELHWHPQCPGTIISTAHSGINIFRTISV